MRRPLLALLVVPVALHAQDPSPARPTAAVVSAVEEIDAMRSGLAATLEGRASPPDQQVFGQVCRPVGERAKAVAAERGWQVLQMAARNRNAAHALDAEGARVSRMFEADAGLTAVWLRSSMNGTPGMRYFRRITVEASCLACHGARDARPAFVVTKYPDDRAFDFKPGDLRGLYAVFVPDSLAGKE